MGVTLDLFNFLKKQIYNHKWVYLDCENLISTLVETFSK